MRIYDNFISSGVIVLLFCKYNKKIFLHTDDFQGNILSVFRNKTGVSALICCLDFKNRVCEFDDEYNILYQKQIYDKTSKLKLFKKENTYMGISYSSYGKIDILDKNFCIVDSIYPKVNFNNGHFNSASCSGSEILLCYSNAIFSCDNELKPKLLISSQNGNVFIDSIICGDYCWVIEYFDARYSLSVYEKNRKIYSQPLQSNLCVTSLCVNFDKDVREFIAQISAYSNTKNYILISKYGFET